MQKLFQNVFAEFVFFFQYRNQKKFKKHVNGEVESRLQQSNNITCICYAFK